LRACPSRFTLSLFVCPECLCVAHVRSSSCEYLWTSIHAPLCPFIFRCFRPSQLLPCCPLWFRRVRPHCFSFFLSPFSFCVWLAVFAVHRNAAVLLRLLQTQRRSTHLYCVICTELAEHLSLFCLTTHIHIHTFIEQLAVSFYRPLIVTRHLAVMGGDCGCAFSSFVSSIGRTSFPIIVMVVHTMWVC